MKEVVILGGPNGAGKTTAARVLLPKFFSLRPFLNADDIARDLAPGNAESAAFAAGRLLIEHMWTLVHDGQSFALETTCAGRSYIPLLKECKAKGWRVSLFYFWLPSPEHSIARVARRVSQGGHHIPDEVIYRRFKTGLWNMRHLCLPLADVAAIYDNSGCERILIAERESGCPQMIHDQERWSRIEELTQWKRHRDRCWMRLIKRWPKSPGNLLPANSMGLVGTTRMRSWRQVRLRAVSGLLPSRRRQAQLSNHSNKTRALARTAVVSFLLCRGSDAD
jgi:predicted ABC-type ATPase